MEYIFKTYRKNLVEDETNDMCKLGWRINTAVLNAASQCWEIIFERDKLSNSPTLQAKRGRPPKNLKVETELLKSEE